RARERLAPIRRDSVEQLSFGLHYANETRWTDRLHTILGLRADRYAFDVTSALPENSGSTHDTIVSPKASLIFSPADSLELFVSAGKSFHSNDARGTTITTDPASGEPAERVDPLVESRQAEIGFR